MGRKFFVGGNFKMYVVVVSMAASTLNEMIPYDTLFQVLIMLFTLTNNILIDQQEWHGG